MDYGAVFDEHMAGEFVAKSIDTTMATMVQDPVVLHVPTSTGGRGGSDVRRFYDEFFIGTFPADFEVRPLSRTIGEDRLVDEMIISFTHTREVPILLPGVEPTGRHVRLPLVAIVGFADGKVASEHLYWDQASLLVQAGLLDPAGVPVRGVEETIALEADQADNRLLDGVPPRSASRPN
jgi:carboxymethylenebutenolidase